MATAAQALEDFCLAYRAMLAAARRVRLAVRAEAAGQAAPGPRRIDTQDILTIQRVVAEHYGLTVAELVSRLRPSHIAMPRLMAIELCSVLTEHRQVTIGDAFCRNHSMVIHACRQVRNQCETYPAYARDYDAVRTAVMKSLAALYSQAPLQAPTA